MSEPLRLCRDCIHVEPRDDAGPHKCSHPASSVTLTNFYDGSTEVAYPTVSFARMCGACGDEGKLWEAKPGFV